MIEVLSSIDVAVFFFINRTLSNPMSDAVWPLITEYSSFHAVRLVFLGAWLALLIWGGPRGRTAAALCVVILVAADQLSSAVIKELVGRPRPCHTSNGVPILQGVHLLVHCGSGKSFPSSHAVNNFAMAALFGFYYRKWVWAFVMWAGLVALSRVAVGVHYPSDIVGGALIGTLIAFSIIALWTSVQRRFLPRWHAEPAEGSANPGSEAMKGLPSP